MNIHNFTLQNVSKAYTQAEDTITVLKDISYKFYQDRSYCLQGASGSGKSTLLYLLAGLESPTQGSVFFDSVEVGILPPPQKAAFLQKKVGLVFQYPYLLKECTVLENIILKGLIAGKTKKECSERGFSLLKEVGLEHRADFYPSQLSGGQQQRVALARALFSQPCFLLADEPTGNLDRQSAHQILDLLLALHTQEGIGLIISSHDPQVADAVNIVCHLDGGSLK